MVTAAIVINQSGKPAGTPSTSRDDLDITTTVILTNNDNTGVITWSWEFVSKPPGSSAVLSTPTSSSSSFSPDVRGSYLIKLTVTDGGSLSDTDQRIGAVKTEYLGIRIPAAEETTDFESLQGWAHAIHSAFIAIDADSKITLYKDGSNSPTANISWNSKKITSLSDPADPQDAATKNYVDNNTAAHLMGGSKHTADTLANINNKVSDQDLVGTLTAASGDVSGTFGSGLTVVGIQGTDVSDATLTDAYDGYVLIYRNTPDEIRWERGVFDEHNVKISSADTTPDYLFNKLVSGLNINFTKNNIGADETITIASDGYLKLPEQSVNPAYTTNNGFIFSKDVSGITELFYIDSSGNVTQLTSDGYLATNLGIERATFWEQPSNPSGLSDRGSVYTKDVSGYTELFYIDNYGTVTQITNDGYLSGTSKAAQDSLVSVGTETYIALSHTPLITPFTASGRDLQFYRNGVLLKWVAVISSNPNEWTYNSSSNRVEFAASGASDWYSALYNKN